MSKYDCNECGDIRQILCTASEVSSDPVCFQSKFPKPKGFYSNPLGHHLTNVSKERFLEPHNAKCQLCLILSQSRIGIEPVHANENPDELRALPFAMISTLVNDLRVIKAPMYALFIGQREAFKSITKLVDKAKNGVAVLSRSQDALSLFSPRIVPEYYDPLTIRGWIQYCQEYHKLCLPTSSAVKGLRLIDCKSRMIRLAEDDDQYAALSYVWGKPGRSSNHKTQYASDSPELPTVLPQVIEDAIRVTLSLGYDYLWVDKLCIDQNDPSAKHDQLQQMGVIYERAVLTIIAASGIDQDDGLSGVSTPRMVQTRIKLKHASLSWVVDPQHAIHRSRWSMRGWTFQEVVLSRRRLVFTKEQVYFECDVMNCREDLHTELDSLHTEEKTQVNHTFRAGMFGRNRLFGQMDPRTLSVYELWTFYWACVKDYSRRELAYGTDALNAFRGIINRFRSYETKGLEEVLGLSYPMEQLDTRSKYLHFSLCWFHDGPSNIERRPQFPSWTWAGWSGEVRLDLPTPYPIPFFDMGLEDLGFEDRSGKRLELCRNGRQNLPPNSEILFLRLKARMIPGNWFTCRQYPKPKLSRRPPEMQARGSWKVSGYKAYLHLSEKGISDAKLASELNGGHTWRCIYIGWCVGYWLMLLQRTSPGIWSRAGVFVVYCGRDALQFHGDEAGYVEYTIG